MRGRHACTAWVDRSGVCALPQRGKTSQPAGFSGVKHHANGFRPMAFDAVGAVPRWGASSFEWAGLESDFAAR